MEISAKFIGPPSDEGTRIGILIIDGREWAGPLPPNDGPLNAIYHQWLAEGGEVEEWAEPDPDPKFWDRALDFKLEFSAQERAAMRNLAKRDANAEDFLDLLNSVGRVTATDPLLLQGLGYFVQKAVLTQERVNEVLGVVPPPVEEGPSQKRKLGAKL